MNADRPNPGGNGAGPVRPAGDPDTSRDGHHRAVSEAVSMLDRVTLQLGVAVAVVIATCSYAVSATSLYMPWGSRLATAAGKPPPSP